MKRFLASIALAFALGCWSPATGSGVAKTEARSVAAFSEIAAANGLDVRVHVGAALSVTVSGDDNLVPLVKTEVSANRLRIGIRAGQSVRTNLPLHVEVAVPSLEYLSASSGCHVVADSIKADTFELRASSGASETVSGTAATLAVNASSGVSVDAGGFASKAATIHASSGSKVVMRATDEVRGEASSGSDVTVLGAPRSRGVSTSSGSNVAYE